jgi:hypothetical protein
MDHWKLLKYQDAYNPYGFGEPETVGIFEEGQDDEGPKDENGRSLLAALVDLKDKSPRCLPVVLQANEIVEILHAVRKGMDYDALFQSIRLADSWMECQIRRARMRYSMGLDREPDDGYMVTGMRIQDFPTWVQSVAPKSVWEWLREPAL